MKKILVNIGLGVVALSSEALASELSHEGVFATPQKSRLVGGNLSTPAMRAAGLTTPEQALYRDAKTRAAPFSTFLSPNSAASAKKVVMEDVVGKINFGRQATAVEGRRRAEALRVEARDRALEAERARQQETIARLREEKAALEQQERDLGAQIIAERETIDTLTTEKEQSNQELRAARQAQEEATAAIEAHQVTIGEKEESIALLAAQGDRSAEELQILRASLEETNQEKAALEGTLLEKSRDVEALTTRTEEQAETIAQKTTGVQHLLGLYQGATAELAALRMQRLSLQEQRVENLSRRASIVAPLEGKEDEGEAEGSGFSDGDNADF